MAYQLYQMGTLGYKKREPVELDVAIEKPTTLSRLIEMHLERLGYTPVELGRALHLNFNDFEAEYMPAKPHARILKFHNYM